MTAHLGDDGFFFEEAATDAEGISVHSLVVVGRTCGRTQLIKVICSDPLCDECVRIRTRRIQTRWRPVLSAMHNPRMITLTMRSLPVLAVSIVEFQESFRRFMDLRLGKRGLPKLLNAALGFVHSREEKMGILGKEEKERAERWETSIEKFGRSVQRKEKTIGKPPRMRDVTGPGFASSEVTYDPDEGWHFHRHCIVDGEFIPWPVLVAAWTIATKGKGYVSDIRAVGKKKHKRDGKPRDPMQEAIKYVTKHWEIPKGKRTELRQAVRTIKRIWPLGGAHPEDGHSICPWCKKEECRAHLVTGTVQVMDKGTLSDGTQYIQVWDDFSQVSYMFVRDHGKGVWEELQEGIASLVLKPSVVACRSP